MKMKNSGIEWIGEIPEDWEVKSIKQLLIERTEKNTQYQTDIILSLSAKDGVTLYDGEHHAGNRPREDLSDYKVVYPNDIVVNSMNILSGSVGLSGYKGCVSPVYYIYYPRENDNVEFMHYIFQCKQFQLSLRGLGNGILIKETENGNLNTIRMRIPSQKLGVQLFPWCNSNRQQRIADYLDKKCAAVDRLMENQRLQIEKLKEYKQSVITEAVTKGLDKTVPLKSSGVEWIGDICKWFELRRLKEVAQILDEYRKPITADLRNQEADVLYDYYGASGVIDKIDGYTIDDHVMLIGEDGANLRMRNLPLMYEVKGKAWINNHAHILKPNADMNFYYLFYCLESLDINPYITGSAQPKLSQENLKNILLPVPPLSQQQQIAEYLDKKCAKIDKLISIKQQKIEKLTEYKKSLIYEYVTGKKEVG